MRYVNFLIFVLTWACSSLYSAEDYSLSRLKGISSIKVADVYFIGETPDKLGVSSQKIKSTIELRLRQCGINVTKVDEEDDSAFVFVEIKSIGNEQATPVYISIELCEDATIDRNKRFVFAVVWSNWTLLLYGNKEKLSKEIVHTVNEFMDNFSNLYLEANPRKFIEQTPASENK